MEAGAAPCRASKRRHEEIPMIKTAVPVLAFTLAFTPAGRTVGAQDPHSEPKGVIRGGAARWAITTNLSTDTASVYAIVDGALTLQSTVATADGPRSLAVHPGGRFAYLASATGRIQVLHFDRTTGTLRGRGSVALPGDSPDPNTVAVEPLGRFLYVTDYRSSTVSGFWIHPLTGGLSLLPGFPLPTGAGPEDIVFDKHGEFAFVGNLQAATLSSYRIGLAGSLTPVAGSPFTMAPSRPRELAFDPNGRFLYATRGLDAGVSAFRVDEEGVLTPVPGSPFPGGADTIGVAASLDGRTLYVSDPAIERVLMRRIDGATGALSPLTPSSVAAGNNVEAVRPDPSGRFLYAASAFPGAIFSYTIDDAGILTPVATSPAAADDGINSLVVVR
jgi:6-phosphogluconolactonase (cycloisomerase 2 family)